MSMMSRNIPKPPPRKLTAPQQRVMDAVKKHGVYICYEGYRPARKLMALGLVDGAPLPYAKIALKLPKTTHEEGSAGE